MSEQSTEAQAFEQDKAERLRDEAFASRFTVDLFAESRHESIVLDHDDPAEPLKLEKCDNSACILHGGSGTEVEPELS